MGYEMNDSIAAFLIHEHIWMEVIFRDKKDDWFKWAIHSQVPGIHIVFHLSDLIAILIIFFVVVIKRVYIPKS